MEELILILTAWLGFLGAAIGSFLNVVVYRLPLGKSLVSPPSHCPNCMHPIRWYDNVPVLGWLLLGGKCRDCHRPISARYPLVEAACGGVFATVGFLSLRHANDLTFSNLFFLSGIYSVFIVSLFAAGLIEYDGEKVPWPLIVPSFAIVPFACFFALEHGLSALHGYGMIGSAIQYGFMLGVLTAWFLYPKTDGPIPWGRGILWSVWIALGGFYLGWLIFVAVLFMLLAVGVERLIPNRVGRCPYLLLALMSFGVLIGTLI